MPHDLIADRLHVMGERVRHSIGSRCVKQLWMNGVKVPELFAFGLRDIEDVHDAEATDLLQRLLVAVFRLDLSLVLARSKIAMPFSPFFTKRPSDFHRLKPATTVASGRCRKIIRWLLKL
jgi:hypothetical protein